MNSKIYHGIGLMSGSSLDGLDLCYASFKITGDDYTYEILQTAFYSYDDAFRNKILLFRIISNKFHKMYHKSKK